MSEVPLYKPHRCRARREQFKKVFMPFTLQMKQAWPESGHVCLIVSRIARQWHLQFLKTSAGASYSRHIIPRALWWSKWGRAFFRARYPCMKD